MASFSDILTAPLAGLYGTGVLGRRWAYDQGFFSSQRPPLPCVSVGGLEVGGTGKTPVAHWLVQSLQRQGVNVGLLTRGYRRERKALWVRERGAVARARDLGDEAAMLVQLGCDVPIAAAASRLEGARALAERGCTLAVLDDGFVHRALARDLDIVVLRADAPFGVRSHFVPWGSLREPPSSLARAQVIWLHTRHAERGLEKEEPRLRQLAPDALWVHSALRVGEVLRFDGEATTMQGLRTLLAAGVANPQGFKRLAAQAGAHIVGHRWFRDHHRFSSRDVEGIERARLDLGADRVLVTSKDAVKLRELQVPPSFCWLRAELEVAAGGESVLSMCRNLAERGRGME